MPKNAPKIVIIGAGGVTFPIRLIIDILSFDALKNSVISLYDINVPRLKRTAKLAARLVRSHELPTRVEMTTNRRDALRQADYVIIAFQVGGLDAYKIDKDVSLKYGIDLCVGDTLNAGGVFRGLRSLGALAEIARDVSQFCPEALVLNYANPMAINCWGLNNTGIRTVGLCHSVQGTTQMLASVMTSTTRIFPSNASASTTRRGSPSCGRRAGTSIRACARRCSTVSRRRPRENAPVMSSARA